MGPGQPCQETLERVNETLSLTRGLGYDCIEYLEYVA